MFAKLVKRFDSGKFMCRIFVMKTERLWYRTRFKKLVEGILIAVKDVDVHMPVDARHKSIGA